MSNTTFDYGKLTDVSCKEYKSRGIRPDHKFVTVMLRRQSSKLMDGYRCKSAVLMAPMILILR